MQQVIGRNAIGAQTYTTTLQTKRLGCPMKKTHVQNLQGRMLAENTFWTNTFWQSTLGRVSCQGYPWQSTLAHKKLISKWLPFSKVYVCITAYRKNKHECCIQYTFYFAKARAETPLCKTSCALGCNGQTSLPWSIPKWCTPCGADHIETKPTTPVEKWPCTTLQKKHDGNSKRTQKIVFL